MVCWRVSNNAHFVVRLLTLLYLGTISNLIIVCRWTGKVCMRACWIGRAVFWVICLPTVVSTTLRWLFLFLNYHTALVELVCRGTGRWSILSLLYGQNDPAFMWFDIPTLLFSIELLLLDGDLLLLKWGSSDSVAIFICGGLEGGRFTKGEVLWNAVKLTWRGHWGRGLHLFILILSRDCGAIVLSCTIDCLYKLEKSFLAKITLGKIDFRYLKMFWAVINGGAWLYFLIWWFQFWVLFWYYLPSFGSFLLHFEDSVTIFWWLQSWLAIPRIFRNF